MIDSSAAYSAAIGGYARRMMLRAIIEIISPDIVYGDADSSGLTIHSRPEQLHDKEREISARLVTTELNRWVLDGSFALAPDDPAEVSGEIGAESAILSGADGSFPTAPWVELRFSGVNILQACSVYFSTAPYDGHPVDFVVDILQGGVSYYSESFEGFQETSVDLRGFTVYNPDAIRVTVSKWSLPYRRMRTVEIIPGTMEEWSSRNVSSMSITQKGSFDGLSLAYGTCTIAMDNRDRRFEPRSKTGVFQSIEERQGIPVFLGPKLPDGTVEYKPKGIYYQANGGWKTGDNGLTMSWDLVDIVGLLVDRSFEPPDTLPTTLAGWVALLVAHLGANFEARYHVDPDYASLPVSVDKTALEGKKCGDVLLWLCQATQTWPRADDETGYLTVEPLWSAGSRVTLDALEKYPTIKANDDIAALSFTLSTGAKLTIPGTSSSSPKSANISNPFLHSADAARAAARWILQFYGGNKLETTGRGNPASEIGDVDVIWLDESSSTNGRRLSQTLAFSGGILKSCKSVLLQADGALLYEHRETLSGDGVWTGPEGITEIYAILIGGGAAGTDGEAGKPAGDLGPGKQGASGDDGDGGKVWYGKITLNEGQTFAYACGAGGTRPGGKGAATSFGNYSSDAGHVYASGYSDVRSGDVFGRSGVKKPLADSGDGGAGGAGGRAGVGHREGGYEEVKNENGDTVAWIPIGDWIVDVEPGPGEPGVDGASGSIIIYYDIPEASA